MNENETRDYLEGSYSSEVENVKRLMAALASDDQTAVEAALEELDDMPLCLDVMRRVDVVLGFGGPNVWIEVMVGPGDYVQSVTWRGAWGGEQVSHVLDPEDGGLGEWATGEALIRLGVY